MGEVKSLSLRVFEAIPPDHLKEGGELSVGDMNKIVTIVRGPEDRKIVLGNSEAIGVLARDLEKQTGMLTSGQLGSLAEKISKTNLGKALPFDTRAKLAIAQQQAGPGKPLGILSQARIYVSEAFTSFCRGLKGSAVSKEVVDNALDFKSKMDKCGSDNEKFRKLVFSMAGTKIMPKDIEELMLNLLKIGMEGKEGKQQRSAGFEEAVSGLKSALAALYTEKTGQSAEPAKPAEPAKLVAASDTATAPVKPEEKKSDAAASKPAEQPKPEEKKPDAAASRPAEQPKPEEKKPDAAASRPAEPPKPEEKKPDAAAAPAPAEVKSEEKPAPTEEPVPPPVEEMVAVTAENISKVETSTFQEFYDPTYQNIEDIKGKLESVETQERGWSLAQKARFVGYCVEKLQNQKELVSVESSGYVYLREILTQFMKQSEVKDNEEIKKYLKGQFSKSGVKAWNKSIANEFGIIKE